MQTLTIMLNRWVWSAEKRGSFMAPSLEDIAAKVNVIAKRNPVYTDIIRWVGDLLSATVTASEKFRPPKLDLGQGQPPEIWYQGKSLFNPGKLDLDWKQARALEIVSSEVASPNAACIRASYDGRKRSTTDASSSLPISSRLKMGPRACWSSTLLRPSQKNCLA